MDTSQLQRLGNPRSWHSMFGYGEGPVAPSKTVPKCFLLGIHNGRNRRAKRAQLASFWKFPNPVHSSVFVIQSPPEDFPPPPRPSHWGWCFSTNFGESTKIQCITSVVIEIESRNRITENLTHTCFSERKHGTNTTPVPDRGKHLH